MTLDEAGTRAARRHGERRSRTSDRLGSRVVLLCARARPHGVSAVRRSEVHRRGDVAAARGDGGKGRCKGESGQFGSSDWVYSVELTRSPTWRMLGLVARSKRSQFSSSSLPPTNAGHSRSSSLAGIPWMYMRPHTMLSATRTIPPDDRATLLPSVLEPLLFPALVLVSDTVTLCHQAARSEHPSARSGLLVFFLMTRDKLPPARALTPSRAPPAVPSLFAPLLHISSSDPQ